MNYKTKALLSDEELKWYYQGKMLDDADEMGVYDEYMKWLSSFRDLDDIKEMNEHFDNAVHTKYTARVEGNKLDAKNYIKEKLS